MHTPMEKIQRGEPIQEAVNIPVAVMFQTVVACVFTVARQKELLCFVEDFSQRRNKPHGITSSAGKTVIQIQIDKGSSLIFTETIPADQFSELNIQLFTSLKT